jgi:hypothetical protein
MITNLLVSMIAAHVLREFFEVRDLESHYLDGQYDLSQLAISLAVRNALAMTRPATVEATDCLDAYYKVGTTSLA